jgi:hypothetical protein
LAWSPGHSLRVRGGCPFGRRARSMWGARLTRSAGRLESSERAGWEAEKAGRRGDEGYSRDSGVSHGTPSAMGTCATPIVAVSVTRPPRRGPRDERDRYPRSPAEGCPATPGWPIVHRAIAVKSPCQGTQKLHPQDRRRLPGWLFLRALVRRRMQCDSRSDRRRGYPGCQQR